MIFWAKMTVRSTNYLDNRTLCVLCLPLLCHYHTKANSLWQQRLMYHILDQSKSMKQSTLVFRSLSWQTFTKNSHTFLSNINTFTIIMGNEVYEYVPQHVQFKRGVDKGIKTQGASHGHQQNTIIIIYIGNT